MEGQRDLGPKDGEADSLGRTHDAGAQRKPRIKHLVQGFPGGTVVKNLPANAGDTGLSPGPGRSQMLQSH